MSKRPFILATTLLLCATFGPSGCDESGGTSASAGGLTKVRVGYIGITCEAPIFTAVEKGFFKEEGLDVELVRCQWATYKDALALGRFDVTHHLVMYFLKPIEQGMDVKFTGGVHKGCLRVQAPINGNIHSIKDLKGKVIGVPGLGTPPFMFACRVMGAQGVDPSRDVQWRVYPAGELGLALDRGLVDAVANSEPIGSLLVADGKVKTIADQAKDAPYKDEYCCAVLVNGKYLNENPKAAAAATRALLKGAKWVEANPAAAARLSVEKKYIASTVEVNAYAISNLTYVPSVSGGEAAIISSAEEMKKAGMLSDRTDVNALAKKAFVHLDGVTDEWVTALKVEKLPDGDVPPGQDITMFARAALAQMNNCCVVGGK
ncbi:MAG TPA: ABC transporter substrate-binding protein [Tepidisphaeraceae bacterium]|nr:ABC transporter substrate-binding protein [Tepidisphaeraceae bacterium]